MSYLLEKFKMKGKVMEICDRYARNILASLSTVAHTGDYNDLSNKPTIPSLNNYYNKDEVDDIVDDINQLPSSSGASIGDVLTHTIIGDGWYPPVKELPVITSGDNGKVLEVDNGSPAWVEPQIFSQEQSNWTEADTTSVSYIKNKPNLATVATSGSYNDLSNGFIETRWMGNSTEVGTANQWSHINGGTIPTSAIPSGFELYNLVSLYATSMNTSGWSRIVANVRALNSDQIAVSIYSTITLPVNQIQYRAIWKK